MGMFTKFSASRLHDFLTHVSSDAASPLTSTDKQLCLFFAGGVGSGATVTFDCLSTLRGRY